MPQVLPDKVAAALKLDGKMRELALKLKDASSMLFLARGYNYATALEAALKVGAGQHLHCGVMH